MKKLFCFVLFVLMVILILSFLTDISFAKDNLGRWLNRMPGRPPRAYLSPGAYLHSSTEYPGVNVSSHIVKLCTIQNDWIDLPAKSSYAVSGILGLSFSTSTLDGATSSYGDTHWTDSPVPRTLYTIWNSTSQIWNNVTITGRDGRGRSISEVVVATAAAQTETSNAFCEVTSVVLGPLSTSGEVPGKSQIFQLGTGDKIGATAKIRNFHYASEDYVTQSTGTYVVNHIYNTILPANVPNAALDYRWLIEIDSEANPR